MKRVFSFLVLTAVAMLTAVSLNATDLTGKRIYVNPGHGSFGPNDRPMATIPYPNLPTTGMPDTCGFYESNTDLWKCLELGRKLQAAGAFVMYSRTQNGPWPYEKVDGDYPAYTWAGYQALPNYTQYNRNLSEICEEVEANNMDMFISIHSNAASDGSTSNYPLLIYRGYDNPSDACQTTSRNMSMKAWPYTIKRMESGLDPKSAYSSTNPNVRGDINFYGSSSSRTSPTSGKTYTGYLGVLKHGTPGYLAEGYYHTYQPARHRALNVDYCKDEGIFHYRAVCDYFGATPETTGYILGTVKDMYNKINHRLFTYAPKTNDQWMPCNGAVVTLKKNGAVVATYQVDTLYNGVFYFPDLQPGIYTLDATCDGFYALDNEQKALEFEVKANQTTYPMIYLRDTSWRPEEVVYETYPTPVQDANIGLGGKYAFGAATTATMGEVLTGKTVRRVLFKDAENMFVLAVDAQGEPSLLLVNPATGAVKQTLPTDFCQVSPEGKLKLADIALTADGYLIGCNEEKTTFTPSNTWRVYKWSETEGVYAGAQWLSNTTNETACNFSNAIAGSTLAFAGTLADGTLFSTAYTIGSAAHACRFFMYSIAEGNYVGAWRNQDPSFVLTEYGHDLQLIVSPRSDKKAIVTSSTSQAWEWQVNNNTASGYTDVDTLAAIAYGATAFKYAGKQLLVAPVKENGLLTGVQMYDITGGMSAAKPVRTNIAINSVACSYATVRAFVSNADITLFVVADSAIYRYTTAGTAQPVVARVSAHGLTSEQNGDTITLSFTTNEDINAATLVLYHQDGTEAGSVSLTGVVKGANTLTLNAADLPADEGDTLTWAIRLEGDPVANWGQVFKESGRFTRPFVSVNTQPESDYFGCLYVMERVGGSNAGNGFYAYTPDYQRVNQTVLKGGRTMFGSPYRTFVDDQGYIWVSDGSDGYSGIFVVDPANLNGTFEEFWAGATRTTTGSNAGLLTNNGVVVGSSSLGLSIYGTGADAKLLSFNEDAGEGLPALSLAIYNIGQEEGTYLHHWTTAPSQVIALQGTAAIDGYPLGTSHGFWFATRRSSGNNNASATALQFYDWSGARQMSSAVAPFVEMIDGSYSGACAMNKEENVLYFIDGSKHLMVFDVEWEGNKPNMTLRYSYNCGLSSIREMHLDYAGNLVTSGEDGLVVFTIPTDNNTTLIPAKSTYLLTKTAKDPTALESTEATGKVVKLIEQGRVIIVKDGVRYTVTGQRVD